MLTREAVVQRRGTKQTRLPFDPMPTPDVVDGHILTHFSELVVGLGGQPATLLTEQGIDPAGFATGEVTANYRQMVELVATAAERLHCADFGMRLAMMQEGTIRSPLVALMESCRTVGEALRQASDHSNAHSPVAAIWQKSSDNDEDFVLVGHDILLDGLPRRAQAMEQILLIAHRSIRAIAGGAVQATRVLFRHEPISATAMYRRHFGCGADFGQEVDALVFRRRDMDRPTAKPDNDAFQSAIAQIDAAHFPRSPTQAEVRGAIMRGLATGRCNTEHVANGLGLHIRTMHRRLASEGTSFQRIKNQVRWELAIYCLEDTTLEFGVISERLGFSEQSAFTHFCRKTTKASPSDIRLAVKDVTVRNEQVKRECHWHLLP